MINRWIRRDRDRDRERQRQRDREKNKKRWIDRYRDGKK